MKTEHAYYGTQAELKEAVEQELQETVDQMREEVIHSLIELDDENNTSSSFYHQPNSDDELEEFMKSYGVDTSSESVDDVLKELEEKKDGGDA